MNTLAAPAPGTPANGSFKKTTRRTRAGKKASPASRARRHARRRSRRVMSIRLNHRRAHFQLHNTWWRCPGPRIHLMLEGSAEIAANTQRSRQQGGHSGVGCLRGRRPVERTLWIADLSTTATSSVSRLNGMRDWLLIRVLPAAHRGSEALWARCAEPSEQVGLELRRLRRRHQARAGAWPVSGKQSKKRKHRHQCSVSRSARWAPVYWRQRPQVPGGCLRSGRGSAQGRSLQCSSIALVL